MNGGEARVRILAAVDDRRIGSAIRALRMRRDWRQADLAEHAMTSRWTIARIERGRLGTVQLETLRCIADALDARIDVLIRWQGGELDRLLNARHGRFHDLMAKRFEALPVTSLELV